MECLQEKVGSYEVGEVVIIVVLIHLEQLVVVSGHDGESVLSESLFQLLRNSLHLERVYQVVDIHLLTLSDFEVLLAQLYLVSLELFDEPQFTASVAYRFCLVLRIVAGIFLLVLFPPSLIHQTVVPRCGIIYASEVGRHQAVALSCRKSIAQHTCLADAQLRYILREINLFVEFLNVDMSLSWQDYLLLLGTDIKCHGSHE